MATRFGALRGFYGVVNLSGAEVDPQAAGVLAERLLVGGASVVQVRMKRAASKDVLAVSLAVAERTSARGAKLVINDRVDVALLVGADAVHLGQADLSLSLAREAIAQSGQDLAIGISTHSLEQVGAAVRAGADYLGFGPVFVTSSKENPDAPQGLDSLAAAVRAAGQVPVVAIGGITPARAAAVAKAGAAAACAISSVNAADDLEAAGQAIAAAFA